MRVSDGPRGGELRTPGQQRHRRGGSSAAAAAARRRSGAGLRPATSPDTDRPGSRPYLRPHYDPPPLPVVDGHLLRSGVKDSGYGAGLRWERAFLTLLILFRAIVVLGAAVTGNV